MTIAGQIVHPNSHAGDAVAEVRLATRPLHLFVGFFIAFRLCITYLGFQSDPRTGTIANLVCGGLLLSAALFSTLGDEDFSLRPIFASRTLRWLFAYLAVSGISLCWTAASSAVDAAGQWTGMAMQVATVLLLVHKPHLPEKVDALLKGFVIGMLLVALVAWLSPQTEDLRLGDTDFLHPNILGMNCAIAFFFAQYLSLRKPGWKWCCLALGITLLRTFSKTSIIAFLLAESFYLLREKNITRSMKIKIVAAAAIILAAFATLTQAYLAGYTNMEGGNATETLTGRTFVWGFAYASGIEHPWIGHGFYSFRALAPLLGSFQPWAAHNEVLQQFFEYGLLGVLVAAGLYLSLFLAAKRSSAMHYRTLVFVLILFVLIHGLTESLNFDLTFPLWLAAALALVWQHPSEVASS
jgi:O-antigen ligase